MPEETPILYTHTYFTTESDFPFDLRIRSNENLSGETHAHDHMQICYVHKGTCTHFIEMNEVRLVRGDLFSVPPYTPHSIHTVGQTPVELFQIDFMPRFIHENLNDLSDMTHFIDFAFIRPMLFANDTELQHKMSLPEDAQYQFEHLTTRIREELQERQEGYKLSVRAYLLQLLVLTTREYKRYTSGSHIETVVSLHRKAFHEATEYIHTNYDEEMKLEEMARRAAVSPAYFSTLFKVIHGKSFTEYVNDVRINKATEALKKTDRSVQEICLDVGYNNLAHFNRMFKRVIGVTPSQYRKQFNR